jgi:glycosyltransferase involved in cell wall biosynthesis
MRIGAGLAAAGLPVTVYSLNQPESHRFPAPAYRDLPVVHLETAALLLEPYQDGNQSELRAAETARLRALALERAVGDRMRLEAEAEHVLVSFYASGTGFLAQMAAVHLRVPHIVSVRGTDLELDAFDMRKLARLRTAIEGASLVVATNRQQAGVLAALFRPRKPVRVIENAIPEAAARPFWRPPPGDDIRLASDCGFSGRKATQLLLRAVAELLDRGRRVTLTVFGGVFWLESHSYWDALRQSYQSAYPGRFSFPGQVSHDELDRHLLASHIYCSASLAEGSSMGRIRALTLGIPILATAVGGITQATAGCAHVRLVPPGDLQALTAALDEVVTAVAEGRLAPDRTRIEEWRRHFSTGREQRDWLAALDAACRGEAPGR